MNARPSSLRLTLLASVAVAIGLSGCTRGEVIDKLSGTEGRKPQTIDGMRRAPMLNPQLARPPTPPSAAALEQTPVQKIEAKAEEKAPEPFEMYDEDGNKVEPEEKSASSSKSIGDYFGKFIQKDSAVRKPIPGNPITSPMFTPVIEPSTANSQSSFVPLSENNPATERDTVSGFVPLVPQAAASSSQAISQEQIQRGEEPNRPSFFSRLVAPLKSGSSENAMQEIPAGNSVVVEKRDWSENADQAKPQTLSSVPPTPEAFKAVKQEKNQKIEEMKLDHSLAQENKMQLESEPSQTQISTPLLETPAGSEVSAAEVGRPVLLGQISDVKKSAFADETKTKTTPAPVEYVTDKQEDAVPASVMVEQMQPKPWWKRWNVMGENHEEEQEAATVDSAVQPVEVKAFVPITPPQPPVMQPLLATPEAPQTVAPFQPQTQPATPLVEYGEKAKEKMQQEVDSAFENLDKPAPAATSSGLPSPEELKKVKTLPPSRYTQPRDRKYYLVP